MQNRSFSLGQMNQSVRRVALLFGLAAVYYFAAKLGLRFAYINSSVTTIWPPAGIALAAFVLLGYGVWPAILAGAFFANISTTGAVFPSLGIAAGNTMEGLLAAYLVNRFALGVIAALVTWTLFGGLFPSRHYPLTVLLWPVMIWVAFRFGPREAVTTMLIVSGIAISRTLSGVGPFSVYATNESLVLLQVWTGITAVTSLVLAAAVASQRDIQGTWRELAVTDALTGLANHRQLIQSLESEIPRSGRTAQPLAVVLLDLDGLKQINDRHGHLTGSLAIRRVAEALLGSCRTTDTAARFGGDEFALVLPETGVAAAWHVARGVADRLATDAEKPNLSISVGVAVYPGHGETVEALLNAADVALYETKERRKSRAVGLAP